MFWSTSLRYIRLFPPKLVKYDIFFAIDALSVNHRYIVRKDNAERAPVAGANAIGLMAVLAKRTLLIALHQNLLAVNVIRNENVFLTHLDLALNACVASLRSPRHAHHRLSKSEPN